MQWEQRRALGNRALLWIGRAVLGPTLSLTAAVTSYLLFRWTIRSRNVRIRWAHHEGWAHA